MAVPAAAEVVGAVDATGVPAVAVFVLLLAVGVLVTGVVEATLTAVVVTLAVEVAGAAADELTLGLPLFSTRGVVVVVANWAAELLGAALGIALVAVTAVALALVV